MWDCGSCVVGGVGLGFVRGWGGWEGSVAGGGVVLVGVCEG